MKIKNIIYFTALVFGIFAISATAQAQSPLAPCPNPANPSCPEYGDPTAPCPNIFNVSCPEYDPEGGSDLGDGACVDPTNPLCELNDEIYKEKYAEFLNVPETDPNPDTDFGSVGYIDDRMCSIDDDPETCKSNNLINAFDGWNPLYRGYEKSQLLFDPKGPNFERQYPELSYSGNINKDDKTKNRSMAHLNLGVSDEINKTTMAAYQPISSLYQGTANDEFRVGQIMDIHKSLLGTAVLTLSQLDKTVAAATLATDQVLQASVANDLSKQISQATTRISNPQLEPVYRDHDEKMEACMASSGKIEGGKVSTEGLANIRFECSESCGPTPKEVDVDGTKVLGGAYAYCVCCAETSNTINKTVQEDYKQFKTEQWSLVDRIFFGNSAPTKNESGDVTKKRKYVVLVSRVFKNLYGDQVLEGKDGKITISYRYPQISISQKIDIIRNGPGNGTDEGSPFCIKETKNGKEMCVGSGQRVQYGICPAIKNILRKWPIDQSKASDTEKKEISDWWREASMGYVLTPNVLNELLALEGIIDENKKSDWVPTGKISRLLDSFCDASAVAAFKKFHYRMQTIAADHLMQNQVASAKEKADFQALLTRVSNHLALAEMDTDADYQAEVIVAGLGSESDSYRLATNSAAIGAAQSAQRSSQALSGSSGFGSNNAQLGN